VEPALSVYAQLDKCWKSTCRVLFGKEIGELKDFQEWLSLNTPPLAHASSSLTGKEITYSITDYCKGSKRASLDEIWKLKKFPPLSLNEIKDIDSLLQAVQERAYYTGNIILGNSNFIERSSNCNDSYYVLDSGVISDSKYVCNSSRAKQSEFLFGSDAIGECKFLVKCYEAYKNVRCLEAWKSQSCADCFYINGVMNSSDCLFCFNVQNKRNAIGNLELSREKYLSLKEKLIPEIAQELSSTHSLPSLAQIVGECKGQSYFPMLKELKALEKIEKPNLSKINSVFENTTQILFAKKLTGIDAYSKWLRSHVLKMEVGKSIISAKPMLLADYSNYLLYPRSRLVTLLEAEFLGNNLHLDEKEISKLSFQNLPQILSKIAYLSPEYFVGHNENVVECSTQYESLNAYRSPGTSFSKNTAYSFWPRNAECIFGSSMAFESFYCINCYYSENLNRCFEADSSKSCSDSYYLHNCENVRNSMFCFNAKNLSYAIGNTVVGEEQFKRQKKCSLNGQTKTLKRKKKYL